MGVAADSKIWIWVVFMVISFTYNAWKKKNKARQEEGSVDENLDQKTNPVDFGLEDLISQFEAQYGGKKKDSKAEEIEKRVVNSEVKSYDSQRARDFSESPLKSVKKQGVSNSFERKTKKKVDKNSEINRETSGHSNQELDVDLRQMIIAQTVLERPKFELIAYSFVNALVTLLMFF